MSKFIASPDGVMFFRRDLICALRKDDEGGFPIVKLWTSGDDEAYSVRGFPDERARDSWIDEVIDPAAGLVHTAHLPSPALAGDEHSGTVPSDGNNENKPE